MQPILSFKCIFDELAVELRLYKNTHFIFQNSTKCDVIEILPLNPLASAPRNKNIANHHDLSSFGICRS